MASASLTKGGITVVIDFNQSWDGCCSDIEDCNVSSCYVRARFRVDVEDDCECRVIVKHSGGTPEDIINAPGDVAGAWSRSTPCGTDMYLAISTAYSPGGVPTGAPELRYEHRVSCDGCLEN